jgi:multiple sugar transport system permease protein
VEGANVFQVLWHIVVPSVKPVIVTQAFITFLGLYNSYLWPSLVISRNENRTITLGIAALVLGENYTNPGLMMASTVVSVLPVMLIFMFANKYIVRGFTQSGIK